MIPQAEYDNYVNSKLMQLDMVQQALRLQHIHFADELVLEMVVTADIVGDRQVALSRLAHVNIDNILDDRRLLMAG